MTGMRVSGGSGQSSSGAKSSSTAAPGAAPACSTPFLLSLAQRQLLQPAWSGRAILRTDPSLSTYILWRGRRGYRSKRHASLPAQRRKHLRRYLNC